MLRSVAVAMLLASASPLAAAPIDTLTEGRQLVASALSEEPAAFFAAADPKFVASVGGADKLRSLLAEARTAAGPEQSLSYERALRGSTSLTYHRVAEYQRVPLGRADLTLSLDGKITGFRFTPTKQKPEALPGYRQKTTLRLPFGEPPLGTAWLVTWGGSTYVDNYHDKNDTYHAFDFSARPLFYAKAPATVAEAPCWGLPILTAATGRVARISDGLADQPMNTPNPDRSKGPGNHVIVDHGNSEFTLYAHLQQGSVQVREGQLLEAGSRVGLCGNSGASTGPHLHFQLMDGADLDTARAIPLEFTDYFAPLRHVARGRPQRGELLLPGGSRP